MSDVEVTKDELVRIEQWMRRTCDPSPVPALPTPEQVAYLLRNDKERLERLIEQREEMIRLAKEDPYRHGFEIECWKEADHYFENALLMCLFGGNGAGKTYYSCRKGVELMIEKPGAKVLWLHESETASVDVQQAAVFHYLPKEYKNLRSRGPVTNVRYTVKGGFTDNRFVLPNGSIGQFGFYFQKLDTYEGGGWDLICADENLPLKWLKTLMIRLPRRKGKFIWAFTPINGITPAVREVVNGARTLEHRPAELLPDSNQVSMDCPAGRMPYVQKSTWPQTTLLYFFSEMNPFANYDEFKKQADRMSKTEIERRFYGWARNTVRTLFPRFGAPCIVTPKAVPEKATRYLVMDPAGARNFFLIWVAVDPEGRHYIYREWPDESMGPWAQASESGRKFDGEPGPAQDSLGYGVAEYKRLILEAEGWVYRNNQWESGDQTEDIFRRLVDPRSGNEQSKAERAGHSSVIERFAEEQRDEAGRLQAPAMMLESAPGLHEEEGFSAINSLLEYDINQPVTALLNEPKLYVVETCTNVIWGLQNYTGKDGPKAACKDPVDCVRYMATAKLMHLEGGLLEATGGGGY